MDIDNSDNVRPSSRFQQLLSELSKTKISNIDNIDNTDNMETDTSNLITSSDNVKNIENTNLSDIELSNSKITIHIKHVKKLVLN